MGYQNNERPEKKIKDLVFDVSADLTDLKNDILRNKSKEDLISAIEFIRISMRKVRNNFSKKEGK